MRIIIGFIVSLGLIGCGGSSNDVNPKNLTPEDPLSKPVSSIVINEDNLYFNLDDYVYLVENNDFSRIYCVGYNPNSSGVAGAAKGLNLKTLSNGYLFTTEGQIFDEVYLIKEYNYDGIEQLGKYMHASVEAPLIVENKYSKGIKYSTDGEYWTTLVDDNEIIRKDARYMWDIQFIGNEDHAMGLFDTVAQGNFLAVFEQGQWNEVLSNTDITRVLYIGGKLLGLNSKSIKILDTETGVILNDFDIEGMRYVSIQNDNIVFTDGIENFKFNLNSLALMTYETPKKVGFITSIAEEGDSIYYGSSNGIWNYKNNEYQQVFTIENFEEVGCSSKN